jgi:hypothetical protein
MPAGFSFGPLQLPLSPMGVFAILIELPNDVTVQRSHDADVRHHRRAVMRDDQQQGFDRGLPFFKLLFGLRKLPDISRRVLEGDDLAAARQRIHSLRKAWLTGRIHFRRFFDFAYVAMGKSAPKFPTNGSLGTIDLDNEIIWTCKSQERSSIPVQLLYHK